MAKENDPGMIFGRDDAEVTPDKRPSDAKEHGHPLPAADNARHGTIPEHIEKERGHGDN
jgi:hypothetical protein